ncbi:hypothetical protein HV819_05595 [Anaerococcus sp. AGMB00486]|uniref:Uncharacterized protein n=2 Tax=Anaerococcus TaxID=165779 RepID=A0ABX2N9T9_9FIRM|nr:MULTISPECIES: hypothetical protein [Anaerococcus]MSS78554.1 hypothetical protein [Anaerococcus porci]NVF11456.1 hypothetical protein [Anaerococcus faecalis]
MGLIISDKGLETLKKIKGKIILNICADDWKDYNRSYGNIKIELQNCFIEIENDYRLVPYFGTEEELAGYDAKILKDNKFDYSVMEEDLYTKEINKQVVGINIIRDTIMIDYKDEDKNEVYKIDQAIIFDFGIMKFCISQTSIFTPMSKITFSEDVEMEIKSIEEVKSEWIDDDLDTEVKSPKYKVHVKRKILEL